MNRDSRRVRGKFFHSVSLVPPTLIVARSFMTVARFEPSGKYIFIGTTAGSLLVFNSRTKAMIARHKISGAGIMKGLDFAKSGR